MLTKENCSLPLLISPRIEGENNREYAYRILRQNIITLQLAPGQTLSEAELSDKLEMSRTPVHEAVMMLKNEWLVDVQAQRGSSVSMIRVDYLREGFNMRLMLEASIMQQLAGRLTMEQLKPFATCIEAQAKVANTGNYETPGQEFVSLDNDFHQLLYHYGGYDRAWQAVHNVTSHYDRVRYMTNAVIRQDENRVVEEHRRFYNYLMLGIPPTVDIRQEMEEHLGHFRDGFQQLLEKFPDFFE